MSKLKSPKAKLTGMDYLYRIVMALLALAVPVVAFFQELVYFVVNSPVFQALAQLKGDTTDNGETENSYSIYKFIQNYGPLLKDTANAESKTDIWNSISAIHAPIISTLVFFATAIVIALVMFFVALFVRKKLPQLIISGLGLISLIGMKISFTQFAKPIIAGDINLGTLFSSPIISTILPYIASVSVLVLASAFYGMIMLFVGMIIWCGSFMLVDSGDKKPVPSEVKQTVKAK